MGGDFDRDIGRLEGEIKDLRIRTHDHASMLQRHEVEIGVNGNVQVALRKLVDVRESNWRRWEDRLIGACFSVGIGIIIFLLTRGH
jgi:hypothetical protein